MKTKRITFVAFLIAALMMLTIGFAAITQVLDVTGTTSVSLEAATKTFNEQVYFSEASTYQEGVSDGVAYTARVNTDNNDKGTFTITGFEGQGQKAVITYTIKSVFDQEVKLSVRSQSVTGANADQFSIAVEFGENGDVLAAASDEAPETTTIIVTVTLNSTPTSDLYSASFAVELSAVAGN